VKSGRRRFVRLAAGTVALPALSRIARAQVWPSRVVRLLVGFPPGGGADAACRLIANRLSEIWKQSVVVENRSGAGGNIALDAAAHAPPDGYTLVLATVAPPIYSFLFGSLGYDPVADLAPVSMIGIYPNILVVSNSSLITSAREYVAYAKANPGKLSFASPGVGTTGHLSGELFKRLAGIEITHVPYRGVAAGAMTDLITGRVDSMFNTTGSLLPSVHAGQVRGLGVSSEHPFETAPELPPLADAAPGYEALWWYGIYVPAKTPDPIVRKINEDIVAMLVEPEIKKRFEPLGVAPASSTPKQLAARAQADAELWGPVIKAENIRGG
jgi:tripartite-type tricarboxylate transporter receptor subunit TctC